ENGRLDIKTKLFLHLLPPAPLLPPPGSLPRSLGLPPNTPKLTRRSSDDLRRNLRAGLGTPVSRRLTFDIAEEDEKENLEPPEEVQRSEDEQKPLTPPDLLSQLLSKWGHAIDQLAEDILVDLRDYKKRLGIPQ
ncbi:E4, partial [Human papillomavirus 130]